jgi:uncharacterized membrane protein
MSDLVAIGYDDLDTARRVASNVTQLQKEHNIELEDLAIVERRQGHPAGDRFIDEAGDQP